MIPPPLPTRSAFPKTRRAIPSSPLLFESLEPRLLLTVAFAPMVNYSSAPGNFSIASADFNHDSHADLVTANRDDSSISVFLNDTTGAFTPKVDYAAAKSPMFVAVADLNGDGNTDIVTANTGTSPSNVGTVSVLINNGNGTFAPRVDYSAGSATISVAIADFNADGKPDLAVANLLGPAVSILLNNGNGTFAPKIDLVSGPGANSIAAADFNGDGKADLAVAYYTTNTVAIFLSNGIASFAAKVDYPAAAGLRSIAVADFNGDGKDDFAVGYDGSLAVVSVWLNAGNGTFAPKVDYPTDSAPYSICAADFNGDGKPDLATANVGNDSVSVLLNLGNGTFAAMTNVPNVLVPLSITSADVNGDGQPDLAVATFNHVVSILRNTTDFPPIPTITSPSNGIFIPGGSTSVTGVAGTAPTDLQSITVKIYAGSTATGSAIQTITTTPDLQTGAYTVNPAALSPGTYTLLATQPNSASNVGSSTPTIIHVPIPGDINENNLVDGADFDIWFINLLTHSNDWTKGDLNADGIVDGADYDLWFTHLGATLPSQSLTAPTQSLAVAVAATFPLSPNSGLSTQNSGLSSASLTSFHLPDDQVTPTSDSPTSLDPKSKIKKQKPKIHFPSLIQNRLPH